MSLATDELAAAQAAEGHVELLPTRAGQLRRLGMCLRAGVQIRVLPSPDAPEVRYFVPAWAVDYFSSEVQLRRAARDVVWREASMSVADARRSTVRLTHPST